MNKWILVCSNCGTPNEIPREVVTVKCGMVYFNGSCSNCKSEIEGSQEYWRWLGLNEALPLEDEESQ
jgi:DNA-directed RNA polymerase subunit RPC12/RpoP